MSDAFGPGILVGLALGLLVGTIVFGLMLGDVHETAAATDCAYYDPKTSEFTWGKLEP